MMATLVLSHSPPKGGQHQDAKVYQIQGCLCPEFSKNDKVMEWADLPQTMWRHGEMVVESCVATTCDTYIYCACDCSAHAEELQ